jgi:hypothetical protein
MSYWYQHAKNKLPKKKMHALIEVKEETLM